MKALILAGGRGKRLNEHTRNKNKCMMEINGRHAIEHSLDYASRNGIGEIVIIVGYRAEEIINRFGNSYDGKKITYVIQWDQKGLVHAIECAKTALDGHDFLLLLGDEVFTEPRHGEMIEAYKDEGAFALCGMIRVEDRSLISKTYSALYEDDGTIHRLVEKPSNPLNDMMGTGSSVLNNGIFDYIDVTPVHHLRKEKELPDLIQCTIDDGKNVKLFEVSKEYVNINVREDLSQAERILNDEAE